MLSAIVQTGGKQYRVSEGDKIWVDRIKAEVGELIPLPVCAVFGKVESSDGQAVFSGEDSILDKDRLKKVKVLARVLAQGKDKKIIVFKYKNKTNYKKKRGHRQYITRLLIEKIEIDGGEKGGA